MNAFSQSNNDINDFFNNFFSLIREKEIIDGSGNKLEAFFVNSSENEKVIEKIMNRSYLDLDYKIMDISENGNNITVNLYLIQEYVFKNGSGSSKGKKTFELVYDNSNLKIKETNFTQTYIFLILIIMGLALAILIPIFIFTGRKLKKIFINR